MKNDTSHRHIPMLTGRDWVGFLPYFSPRETFFCQTCKKEIYSKLQRKSYSLGIYLLQIAVYFMIIKKAMPLVVVDRRIFGLALSPGLYITIAVVTTVLCVLLFVGILPALVFKYCYKFEEVPSEKEENK